jgi:hypothetical protein
MAFSLTASIRHLCRLLIITVLALAISGCALNRKKIGQGMAFPAEPYQTGVTRRDDVLAELGPPLKMTVLPGGYAFMYESLDTQELQIGFSLPVPVVSWFKFIVAQADYDHNVMIYIFDKQHRLIAADDEATHFDLGNTMAVQPVVTVQLLFDTTAVENEVIDFAQWPAYCLLPLPQTLNRANSMNVGVAGVEQRGTASSVGQRTTEMH